MDPLVVVFAILGFVSIRDIASILYKVYINKAEEKFRLEEKKIESESELIRENRLGELSLSVSDVILQAYKVWSDKESEYDPDGVEALKNANYELNRTIANLLEELSHIDKINDFLKEIGQYVEDEPVSDAVIRLIPVDDGKPESGESGEDKATYNI